MSRIKFKNKRKINKKLPFTVENVQHTHKARVYGIKELPDGKFVEVELGTNAVLIGGLRELSFLLYNKRPDFIKKTFEEVLYASADEDLLTSIEINNTVRNTPYVQGFNVYYSGAQGDGVIKYPKYKDGFDFDSLIPFRVIPVELNDFSVQKQKYLHHRIVSISGKQYVEYYTKMIDISVTAEFKNGEPMPNYPDENTTTDMDSRVIAEFPVSISELELVEHFRLRKEEGAEGAHFNSTAMMIGNPANIKINDIWYKTMINTHTYAKSNHVSVAHGIDAFIEVKYQLLHI